MIRNIQFETAYAKRIFGVIVCAIFIILSLAGIYSASNAQTPYFKTDVAFYGGFFSGSYEAVQSEFNWDDIEIHNLIGFFLLFFIYISAFSYLNESNSANNFCLLPGSYKVRLNI